MCSTCCLYTVFLICYCFCPFLSIYFFNLVLKRQSRNGQWYQHLLTLFAIFHKSNTEGANFGLCLYVLRWCNVHVLYCIQLVPELNLWKAPGWPLCGWLGYKPTINNNNNPLWESRNQSNYRSLLVCLHWHRACWHHGTVANQPVQLGPSGSLQSQERLSWERVTRQRSRSLFVQFNAIIHPVRKKNRTPTIKAHLHDLAQWSNDITYFSMSHTHSHACTLTHTHTHTHVAGYFTHTHTCTHAHTHTYNLKTFFIQMHTFHYHPISNDATFMQICKANGHFIFELPTFSICSWKNIYFVFILHIPKTKVLFFLLSTVFGLSHAC